MSVPRVLLIPTHRTGLADAIAAAVAEIVTAQGREVRYHHVGPLAPMSAWDRWEGAVFIDPALVGRRGASGPVRRCGPACRSLVALFERRAARQAGRASPGCRPTWPACWTARWWWSWTAEAGARGSRCLTTGIKTHLRSARPGWGDPVWSGGPRPLRSA